MNYQKYINSEDWKNRRQDYLLDHPYCESPLHYGYFVQATEVNHLTYENMGNEKEEDLQPLCAECHEKVHTNFSFDKNRTIEIGAINEMLRFYYDSRTSEDKNQVWLYFANKISDEFYDGRKLLKVFSNNTSNYFFQNVFQDLLNKGKIKELYHLFEVDVRKVKSFSKYYNSNGEIVKKVETIPEQKEEVKNTDFDFDRVYTPAEFLSLTIEEKEERESHYDLDEDYDSFIDYHVNVHNYKKSSLLSFINKEYMIKFYNCNFYFKKMNLDTDPSWFIKNKGTNYLSYLIVTYL